MFEKFKSDPRNRDQAVGLLILLTFCLLSYTVGFGNGKDAGRQEENPQALAQQAAREAAWSKHIDEVIEVAIAKGDRSCAGLASMFPK